MNFCKKDESIKISNTGFADDEEPQGTFNRRIYSFKIEKVSSNQDDPKLDVYMAIIKGSAFLWHQVRCMMSVLFMIGRGEEPLSVIDQLFDTETLLDRPNYDFAEGNNLILSDCGFEGISWKNHNFLTDLETFNTVREQLMTASIDQCLLSVLQNYYL